MNKKSFIEELSRLTATLSDQERQRLLDYYTEMIDDRVEEGVPEEEAVAALGSPEAIAREFSPAAPASSPVGASSQTVAELTGVRIKVENADVSVVHAPLDNGAAAQLRFSHPERFTWRMDEGVMEIAENETSKKGLFTLRLRPQPAERVSLTLRGDLTGSLSFESVGGDLNVEDISTVEAALRSLSGDIRLRRLTCAEGLEIACKSGDAKLMDVSAPNMRVKTASGDIEASNLACQGESHLETASGDLEVRGLNGGELTLVSASGDIEADRGTVASATIRSASGDVRLDELEANPTLSVETASGDIDLTRCIAIQTRVKAVSGDVSLRLEPLPCGYDISANTVSGSLHLDDGAPEQPNARQPKIDIKTVSGDIRAEIIH